MRRTAFTLIELLAAMGIIVLLSAIALSSTRSIRDGLRLASGVNAATAALELGRSIAIENGEPVLVAFRPSLQSPDGSGPESPNWPPPNSKPLVQIQIMKWTGESFRFRRPNFNPNGTWEGGYSMDRWIPYPDVKSVLMPEGVAVAAPKYFAFDGDGDDDFVCTADFATFGNPIPYGNDYPFEVPAILFDRTGAVAVNNPHSSSRGPWLDWDGAPDRDASVQLGSANYAPSDAAGLIFELPRFTAEMYSTQDARDEPFAGVAPFITIFDLKKALDATTRTGSNPAWVDFNRDVLITNPTLSAQNAAFVLREGKQITFNAYSGVLLK
jgi:prepilin-type N-terminal cleavage/methylation domain-containing protein